MSINYKTREGGATCTIFAPYDCNNNCPFCINKKEYADTSNFSLDKILEQIKVVDEITPKCDFVITGGEPFANLECLDKIISAIPDTHRLFINTTYPCKSPEQTKENYELINKHLSKITSLNISRHLSPIVHECDDSIIAKLPCRRRINCVLYKIYPDGRVKRFVERWAKFSIPIQFRYDYTITTLENLYDEPADEVLQRLKNVLTFISLEGCRMRNNYVFEYYPKDANPEFIAYHKTLPYSTIVEKDENDGIEYNILYDIIIKQNGALHSDWDYTELDLEAYKNVKFEPDDMHFMELNM